MWLVTLLLCALAIGGGIGMEYGINNRETPEKKRVCIIGAGPAGLTSARQILRLNDFEPVVFEINSDVGGQWFYSEKTTDEHGLPVHSGIYKYMRANFPKQLLAYPDYPEFHGENRSYVTHDTVFEYLKNYTDHFDIRRFIQFDTIVEEVDFINNENNWKLKVKNLNTHARNEISCDAVMVCTGNYYKPNIPEIPGIQSFPGRVLHSHDYRRPEEFANQTVALLGALVSGLDISVDLSQYVQKIYLSSRHKKYASELPSNLEQVPGIVAADNSQLILSDGSRIDVDSLILCTGYLYDFPFLNSNTGIKVDDGKYVHPLYKHFINIEHPTMAIIGIIHPGLPLQVAYVQAHYFASLLEGKVELPTKIEMLKESELPTDIPKNEAHHLFDNIIDYYKDLAQTGRTEPLPDFYERAFPIFVSDLIDNVMYFKDKNLYIHANGSIELKCIHQQQNCKNKMYAFPETENLTLILQSL